MILVRWFLAFPLYIVLGIVGVPSHVLSLALWGVPLLLVALSLDLDLASFGLTLVGLPPEWFGRTSDGLASVISAAIGFWPGWALLIVVTGRLPVWLWDYIAWLLRFQWNVQAYVLFGNGYPPFTGEYGEYRPVTFEVTSPARPHRRLPLVQWLLSVPHAVVLVFLGFGFLVAYIGTWWAVIFTGLYPRNLFEFQAGYLQWAARVSAYQQLLTDVYPPFSFGRRVSTAVVVWCCALGSILFIAFMVLAVIGIIAGRAATPEAQMA